MEALAISLKEWMSLVRLQLEILDTQFGICFWWLTVLTCVVIYLWMTRE